jgi:hypothetical protein
MSDDECVEDYGVGGFAGAGVRRTITKHDYPG